VPEAINGQSDVGSLRQGLNPAERPFESEQRAGERDQQLEQFPVLRFNRDGAGLVGFGDLRWDANFVGQAGCKRRLKSETGSRM
jgi:hypothetical protein